MEIKMVKVEDLKPYVNNPRLNDDAVEYVANSIKQFGFKVPMVIDKDNVIVAGHTRFKASLELGLKEVPCIIADDLNEEQIKAFRLADNKVSEKAEWNIELLDEELNDLDIDMSEFGFENINVDDYGTEFSLKEGDREPIQAMSLTFSDDQAETINEAINKMKNMELYKNYENEYNNNSNGNALYLVVLEWLQQKM